MSLTFEPAPSANLLLLSSSAVHGFSFLEYALEVVAEFVGSNRKLYFAPYAGKDYDSYSAFVQKALSPIGITVVSLHTVSSPREVLEEAEVVFVGGGNSFRLLKTLQKLEVIETVRRRVHSGELRYMGASAGSNMACPSLRTTNDMPIVQPASFEAFGLIPFQINPHYVEPELNSTHNGETRQQRIEEFLQENDVPVVGLKEGAWLRRKGQELRLEGQNGAKLFRRGVEPQECVPDSDLSWLLSYPARFDVE